FWMEHNFCFQANCKRFAILRGGFKSPFAYCFNSGAVEVWLEVLYNSTVPCSVTTKERTTFRCLVVFEGGIGGGAESARGGFVVGSWAQRYSTGLVVAAASPRTPTKNNLGQMPVSTE
ncbi:MAG: hypothetical protein WA618_05580, partial [Terriglobales bacterium]